MNKPKNHHYVSQCQQKKHFNYVDRCIYVYDKELSNYYSKKTTKSLFSKDHINTINIDGRLDQNTREKELQILFENDFNKNLDLIIDFLDKQIGNEEIYLSLCFMARIAILGEMRHPLFNEELLIAENSLKSSIFSRKLSFEKNINFSEETIFRILEENRKNKCLKINSYIEMSNIIVERMEPFDFIVYSIESNDCFILPDTSGFQVRGQLKKYPNNLIDEIVQVGIPITDKIFVLATSKAIGTNQNSIQIIKGDNSNIVFQINRYLFDFARKGVACSSRAFLEKTINNAVSF